MAGGALPRKFQNFDSPSIASCMVLKPVSRCVEIDICMRLPSAGETRVECKVSIMLPSIYQTAVNLLPQSADVTLVAVSIFVIAYVYYNYGARQQKTTQSFRQPPRLKSLPVIGSIPYLPGLQQFHTFFLEKLPTMGPVIGFNILSRLEPMHRCLFSCIRQ